MEILDIIALLVSLAAVFSYWNHRFLKLPTTIGLMIMTWGGLRGGISVALALSLPAGPERGLILTMTYVVVVFSIVVQGLTIPKLLQRAVAEETGQVQAPNSNPQPAMGER